MQPFFVFYGMKKIIAICLGCMPFFLEAQTSGRERISMDKNWKFHFGDASDTKNDFNYNTNYNLAKAGSATG